MKKQTADKKLLAAYDTFAKRVGRMLVRKGATLQDGIYRLPTVGGSLTIELRRNWLFCRFQNPIGGFIVSHGLSQCDSGVWNTNFNDDADVLTCEPTFNHVECEIDSFLTRRLSDAESFIVNATGEVGRELRGAFFKHFYRLASVNMAAIAAIESVQSGGPATYTLSHATRASQGRKPPSNSSR
jgi:hypothetical protein